MVAQLPMQVKGITHPFPCSVGTRYVCGATYIRTKHVKWFGLFSYNLSLLIGHSGSLLSMELMEPVCSIYRTLNDLVCPRKTKFCNEDNKSHVGSSVCTTKGNL